MLAEAAEPPDGEAIETVEEESATETAEAAPAPDAAEVVTPSPSSGTVAWRNERVHLNMRPYRQGSIGVMLRYQNAQSHYRFTWELHSQRAHFIKSHQGQRRVLASVALPYLASQAYQLNIVTASDTFLVSVEDKLVFRIRDRDIPSGTVALSCAGDASQCFDQVRIE